MRTNDRWRHLVIEVKPPSMWHTTVKTEQLQAELDRQSGQGWELVSVLPAQYPVGVRLLFRRPN